MKPGLYAGLVSTAVLGAPVPESLPILAVRDLPRTLDFWKVKLGVELVKGAELALPAAGTAGPHAEGAERCVVARSMKEDSNVKLMFAVGAKTGTTAAPGAAAPLKVSPLSVFITLPEAATVRSAFPEAPSVTAGTTLFLLVTDPDGNHICVSAPLSTPLFNGKDLSGWHAFRKGSWKVEEGVLVAEQGANNAGGWLVSDEKYGDCTVSLSFRLSRGANSGICLRYPDDGSAPPKTGVEIQFSEVDPDYRTGSIVGIKAAPHEILRSGWNQATVVVTGKEVVSYLNGREAARATVDRLIPTGHLALQIHGGPPYAGTFAEFKDIVVIKN